MLFIAVIFPSTEKVGEFFNFSLIPRNVLNYFSSLVDAMIKRKLDNGKNAVRKSRDLFRYSVTRFLWRESNKKCCSTLYELPAKNLKRYFPGEEKLQSLLSIAK